MSDIVFSQCVMETDYHAAYASSYNNDYSEYLNMNNIQTFMGYIQPKDRFRKLQKSKEYRNVDIIDRVLRIRMDFGRKPKRIKCSSSRQKKFYDENVLPLLQRYYSQWVYEYHSLGDVFNHFGFDATDRIPSYILTEDPENVDVISALGAEMYKVKISGEFKRQVLKLKEANLLDRLPSHLARYFRKNDNIGNTVTLTYENMYRTTNTKPDYTLYSEPPLMKIAEALELRRLLTASDFSTATKKNEIIHTQVGNKDEKGSKADSRVKAIHEAVTRHPPGDVYLTTAYDVDIKRIGPDPKAWGKEKYEEANSRILQWAGVTVTLISGESSAYGSAVASFRGLEASIDSDCQVFDQFVKHFFSEINRRNGFKDEVSLVYESNRLVDMKDRLAIIKYLVGMGSWGYQDLCEEFDLEVQEQLKKKQWDNKNVVDIAKPWFEEKQGLLAEDPTVSSGGNEPGRPGDPTRNTNQPRPSQ
jgi:hypothetical protein